MKIPGGENSQRRKFPAVKIPGGENSQRRKFPAVKIPGGENSRRRKFSATKIPSGVVYFFEYTTYSLTMVGLFLNSVGSDALRTYRPHRGPQKFRVKSILSMFQMIWTEKKCIGFFGLSGSQAPPPSSKMNLTQNFLFFGLS